MGYNLISPPLYVFPTWSVTNHRCHVCRGLRSQLNNDFVKPIAKHWPSKILTNYMLNFPFAPFVKQRASKWTCSNWRWYFSITWPPKRVRLTQRFWTGLRNCSQHSCDIYPPASIICREISVLQPWTAYGVHSRQGCKIGKGSGLVFGDIRTGLSRPSVETNWI